MRWFPFALFLSPFLSVAQNTPAAAPGSSQKSARVEGTIFSLNGEVVRKATVRLQGGAIQPGQLPVNYSESTDSGGKFSFEEIPPGRYTLSAEKAGFVTARYGARSNSSAGTQLNLAAGTELKDLTIKMTPQGVIAGRILDQDGDPVVSSQVQVMRYSYVRGRKQLQPTGAATTNDLGEYRIINLAPGHYYINASERRIFTQAQERPGHPGRTQEGSITTYYPNGADAGSAAPVEVVAGGEMRGIDIRLIQAKVYTVSGKAVVASGPPPQAIISFIRKEDNGNLPAFLNGGTSQLRPDGSFEFHNITPGPYVLQFLQAVGPNNGQPQNLTGRVEVTVGDANIEGLVLPLGPGPEITGTVRVEDGDIATLLKPAQNAATRNVAGTLGIAQPGRLAFSLIAAEGGPGGSSTAQVKEDGTFQFNALGANKYQLNAGGLPQGTYLKSVRFAGQDVTRALIDTTSGTGGSLELILSSKAGDLAGSVQSEKGESQAGATVALWPKLPDASVTGGIRLNRTDQNGSFRFPSLAPGDYYIAAWEELDPGLAQSADFLNLFKGEASEVRLAENGHESRDVKLVPSDKVLAEIAKLP
jgi:hypothetical protein